MIQGFAFRVVPTLLLCAIQTTHGMADERKSAAVDDVATLQNRVLEQRRSGTLVEAIESAEQLVDRVRKNPESPHVSLADAKRLLETTRAIAAMPPEEKALLQASDQGDWEARNLYDAGKYQEAVATLESHVAVRSRLLGEQHPETLGMLNSIGAALLALGNAEKAEPLLRQVLDGYRKVLGNDHKDTLIALGNFAGFLKETGRPAEAEKIGRELLETRRQIFGDNDPSTLSAMRNLAMFVEDQGRLAESEALAGKALDGFTRVLGEQHPETILTKFNLSGCLFAQSRFAEAEVLIRDVLAARHAQFGEEHPATLEVLNILGMLLERQGKLTDAEPLLRVAIEAMGRVLGEDHPGTLHAVNNLAILLQAQGELAEAEPLANRVLVGYRNHLGPEHPDVLTATANVARLLTAMERHQDAVKLNRETLAARVRTLGKDHPDTLTSMNNLAEALDELAQPTEAQALLREAFAGFRRVLGDDHYATWVTAKNLGSHLLVNNRIDEAYALLAEAHQNFARILGTDHRETLKCLHALAGAAYSRGQLDEAESRLTELASHLESLRQRVSADPMQRIHSSGDATPLRFLAICLARNGKPLEAWRQLERNMARGLLDKLAESLRPLTDEEQARRSTLQAERDKLATLLARATEEEKKSLRAKDAALAAESASFEKSLEEKYGPALGRVKELPEIQASLQPNEAIVAWADLSGRVENDHTHGHWACVVRNSGAPTWIAIIGSGKNGKWTDQDINLTDQVRAFMAGGLMEAIAPKLAALNQQRLAPLEAALGGVDHLIVLPTGDLCGIPIEVITDRFTVSYAPSATMLAWLRSRPENKTDPRLLGLGNPQFKKGQFAALPGTRHEVESIAKLFKASRPNRILLGPEASEKSLEQLHTSGEMKKFRFVHLATHGVLDDQQPWRSALALSGGSSKATMEQILSKQPIDNGMLSAEQILNTWKLNADLVVLSGCETGLGKYHDGEGFLGFSQALLMSGARNMLLSLWKVDDRATTLLMNRFYENLLGRFQEPRNVGGLSFAPGRPLPRAAALREAKAWLRTRSPAQNRLALAGLGFRELEPQLAMADTKRGGIKVSNEKARTPYDYSHPHYWSAFILIGQ